MSYLCANPWTTAFIWANGDVTHCCYSNIGPLGNVGRQSLAEIWRGDRLRYVREKVRQGQYVAAGCEHFCRPFRWQRYYGNEPDLAEIPEGLGRLGAARPEEISEGPTIIGLEVGGRCNLRCTHCLAAGGGFRSIAPALLVELRPYLQRAAIVRVMGGEFTVNPEALACIREISTWTEQPTLFLNTNGHVNPDQYRDSISGLRRLHLKFSLEGLNGDYERVRVGGSWDNFCHSLATAGEIFTARRREDLDWRLYLNYCVMRSNFRVIPEAVAFAVERGLPLVLNTLNGLRHIEENIFFYARLAFTAAEVAEVDRRVREMLAGTEYQFSDQLLRHWDYIGRTLADRRKLRLPYPLLKWIKGRLGGPGTDRLLYLWYKLRFDPGAAGVYLGRKLRKTMERARTDRRKAEA